MAMPGARMGIPLDAVARDEPDLFHAGLGRPFFKTPGKRNNFHATVLLFRRPQPRQAVVITDRVLRD